MIRPFIKCAGSKFYLSSWIIEHFPENYTELGYIEPYVRSGGVFLNKQRSTSPLTEAINDECKDIVQIYRALRDEPGMFIGRLKRTKYCEQTFSKALYRTKQPFADYMDHAVNEFILRKMSKNNNRKSFDESNAWISAIDELPKVAECLKGIYIFNKPSLETLSAYDNKDVLAFVDPPLLAETVEVHENEMSTDAHIKLWEVLNQFRGKVMISSSPSVLYKRLYQGWRCIKKKTSVKVKLDCLWVNY